MQDPPWKRLVEELKDQGYESIYLDRLRASLDVEQQHAILEKEIVQEMAYALGQSAAAGPPDPPRSAGHPAQRRDRKALSDSQAGVEN